jgi:cytochrome c-type biogenesis protein CcmH
MSGWVILALLAAVTLGLLILIVRPRRGAMELLAAALMVGVAGYAWQGSPALPGKPTPPRANHKPSDTLFAAERRIWLGTVGPEVQVLDAADNLIKSNDSSYAIAVLRGGIQRAPDSMILWLGLANALVTYADGSVTPAARYAFEHASKLAPGNPAPAYFMALDYAQMGDLDTAERVWRAVLATSPADAPWRPIIDEKLMILARVRAAR